LGTLEPRPLGTGRGRSPGNTLLPTCVTMPNPVILDQSVYERNYEDLRENFDPQAHLSRTLKVTGTDAAR